MQRPVLAQPRVRRGDVEAPLEGPQFFVLNQTPDFRFDGPSLDKYGPTGHPGGPTSGIRPNGGRAAGRWSWPLSGLEEVAGAVPRAPRGAGP
ncbi:hypothetical protein GCM10010193_05170 [Kitasatospora atroaurantiaca]